MGICSSSAAVQHKLASLDQKHSPKILNKSSLIALEKYLNTYTDIAIKSEKKNACHKNCIANRSIEYKEAAKNDLYCLPLESIINTNINRRKIGEQILAEFYNERKKVKLILEESHTKDNALIVLAAKFCEWDIVHLLEKNGADLNTKNGIILWYAIQEGFKNNNWEHAQKLNQNNLLLNHKDDFLKRLKTVMNKYGYPSNATPWYNVIDFDWMNPSNNSPEKVFNRIEKHLSEWKPKQNISEEKEKIQSASMAQQDPLEITEKKEVKPSVMLLSILKSPSKTPITKTPATVTAPAQAPQIIPKSP